MRFWAFIVLGPFAVIWLFAAVFYALTPVYIDHDEPTMVLIAQQWMFGRPMYHSVDAPYLYSSFYGPVDFLWLALMLSICHNPILASKLSGGFWSLACFLILFIVYRRLSSLTVAIAGVGLVLSYLMSNWFDLFVGLPDPHLFNPFWDRPDPILIFATGLGLFALTLRHRTQASIILAIAIALAVDSKLHGILYLFPTLLVWSRRHGFQNSLLVLSFAAALALVPFLFPSISLHNYLTWLRLGTHHPFVKNLIRECMKTFLVMLIPLALFTGQQRIELKWRDATEESLLLIALLLTGLVLCVPASKLGAGMHHFLPLTPYIGYLFCAAMTKSSEQLKFTWATGVLAIWIIASYLQVSRTGLDFWRATYIPGVNIQADLLQILQKYPAKETQMGVGGQGGYSLTYYSPWICREGTPCIIAVSSYMDMKASGIGSEALKRCLINEQFRYWLIPRNEEPFTIPSWYDWEPLFDDSLRQAFSQHYTKVYSSNYFDIYQARNKA